MKWERTENSGRLILNLQFFSLKNLINVYKVDSYIAVYGEMIETFSNP